jgi:hypothetical protein
VVSVVFGLWAAATFAGLWAICRRSNPEALAVGALLLIAWALPHVALAASLAGGDAREGARAASLLASQAFDALVAVGLLASLWRHAAGWKVAILALLFLQGLAYLAASIGAGQPSVYPVAALWLNLGFAGQLLVMLQPMARDWSKGRQQASSGWLSLGGAP